MEKTEKAMQGKDKPEPTSHTPAPLKQSEQLNISIIIDTYDDIFSDFDPRPYHERALSEDFVTEVRRRHVPHKKGGLEVRFLVPDRIKDQRIEGLVKRRLKSYFKEEEKELEKRISDRKKRGYIYVFVGALLLSTITIFDFNKPDTLISYLLEVLLVPAGWFGMWEGMGKILERQENLESEKDLYRQLSDSVYTFIPESEALKGSIFTEVEPIAKEIAKEAVREVIEEAKSPAKEDPIKKLLKDALKQEIK